MLIPKSGDRLRDPAVGGGGIKEPFLRRDCDQSNIQKKASPARTGPAEDSGGGGEGHRVVHKLSEKPTCTEDGKQERTLSPVPLEELDFILEKGRLRAQEVRAAESGGQGGEAR